MYRESGIDKENGIFFLVALAAYQERSERTLHGADYRDAPLWGDIYVDKGFDKTAGFVFEFGQPVDNRIDGGHTSF